MQPMMHIKLWLTEDEREWGRASERGKRKKTSQSWRQFCVSSTSALSHPDSLLRLHLRRQTRRNADCSHTHTHTHTLLLSFCWLNVGITEKAHLLDVVSCLSTGLDKHHAELLRPLLALLDRDLPVERKAYLGALACVGLA